MDHAMVNATAMRKSGIILNPEVQYVVDFVRMLFHEVIHWNC